jgi:hypothetical protein
MKKSLVLAIFCLFACLPGRAQTKVYLKQPINSDTSLSQAYGYANTTASVLAFTTSVTNTTASGTSIQWTKTAGGTQLKWISPPLAAPVTISGTVTMNVWAFEDNALANATVAFTVKRLAGGVEGSSLLTDSTLGSELGTSVAVKNWTASPASTTFSTGDRIVLIGDIVNVGTMAAAHSVTVDYGGKTGAADGDSWVQFTENLSFTAEPEFIQQAACGANTTNSIPCTFAGVNATGNTLVVFTGWQNQSLTASYTDSAGNTYTGVTGGGPTDWTYGGTIPVRFQAFYANNITGGSAITVTEHFSSAAPEGDYSVSEYAGLANSAVGTAVTTTGSSATALTASITPARQPVMLFAAFASSAGLGSAPANEVQRGTFDAIFDYTTSSTGTQSMNATLGGSANWAAIIIPLTPVSSASVTPAGTSFYGKFTEPGGGDTKFPVVTVCSEFADYSHQPCDLPVTIYTDSSMSMTKANPFRGDLHGNYDFAAPAGVYVVSAGTPFVPGYSFKANLITGGGGSSTPGGTSGQAQFNSGGVFAGVAGSAVDASGQVTLTPTTDGFSALNVNPSSQNFGSVDPVLNVGAGAGTITCKTLGGLAPAQMCINGATNQPWLYNLSILGDATNTASPTIALWDTSRSTPNQAGALWNVGQCASNFSAPGGCLDWGYISNVDGTTSVINMNEDHSIQFGLGGVGVANPFITWGPQGDIPTGYINASTGEISVGWIPNAFAVMPQNGFFSIVNSANHTHKVNITNPGTLAADYNFAMPITAGTAGQVLTSQGGGTTPMTWSTFAAVSGATTIGHCVQFGAGPVLVDSGAGCGGGAGGANVALSNLAGVGINTTLLPGLINTVALGSNALSFTNVFLGTVANQTGSFDTSALTANRSIKIANAASTTVQDCPATANQFLTSVLQSTGACTKAQPTLANIAAGASPAGLFNFAASTIRIPEAAGFVASAVSTLGLDTTANAVHSWINAADAILAGWASAPAGSKCAQSSGTKGLLSEAAGACGTWTDSSTSTGTNKTLSQEGTGNVITVVATPWMRAAGCNNSTAAPAFDLPTTQAPTPSCLTGTNVQKATLDYDDSVNEFSQFDMALPHTWTGAIDINLKWLVSASGGANAVKWTVQTACSADAATYDTAFNAAQTITTNVAANNIQTVSSQATVTVTGCAVDNVMNFKIGRDTSDTFTGTARLIGAQVVLRHTGK